MAAACCRVLLLLGCSDRLCHSPIDEDRDLQRQFSAQADYPLCWTGSRVKSPTSFASRETKVQDSEFPLLALAPSGYNISYRGMKSYNGVAILTRKTPEAVFYGFDDGGEPDDARLLRVIMNGIPIVNTYVPQGFEIESPKYAYKLLWYERLRKYFDKHLSPQAPAIWVW